MSIELIFKKAAPYFPFIKEEHVYQIPWKYKENVENRKKITKKNRWLLW